MSTADPFDALFLDAVREIAAAEATTGSTFADSEPDGTELASLFVPKMLSVPVPVPVPDPGAPQAGARVTVDAIERLLLTPTFSVGPGEALTMLSGPAIARAPEAASAAGHAARPTDPNPYRSDFPLLQKTVNGQRLVWLDSGATTQKPQAVIDAVQQYYTDINSNIHRSAHTLARQSSEAYDKARQTVQRFLGARSASEIVFVRGSTEAINLVAQAWGTAHVRAGDEILVTELEHHANIVPWQMLCERTGARIVVAPVDEAGDIDLVAYERLLGPRTKLVAMTQIANVTGTVVPVAPMIAMAHRVGALTLVDGAQSVAHMPVDVACMDTDFFVFSGHKVFGPTGIGVLYGKAALLERMPPWQGGGNMIEQVSFERTTYQPPPARFEAGTAHIAGAIGLAVALDYVDQVGRPKLAAAEHRLVAYAEQQLRTVSGLRIIGQPRLRAGAVPFKLAGHEDVDVARHLDTDGVAVRAGHHCAQPILRRFGLASAVRPSFALYNGPDDVDALVASLHRLTRSPHG
jgi:cysteine desulfurase / selenocysteine lyase